MGAPLYLRVHVYFEKDMDSSVYHFGHFDPSSTPYLVMYFTQIARKTIYFWNIGFAHSIDFFNTGIIRKQTKLHIVLHTKC